MAEKTTPTTYTCNDFREEMILLGLRKRLQQPDISRKEKMRLLQEIKELEEKMGM